MEGTFSFYFLPLFSLFPSPSFFPPSLYLFLLLFPFLLLLFLPFLLFPLLSFFLPFILLRLLPPKTVVNMTCSDPCEALAHHHYSRT